MIQNDINSFEDKLESFSGLHAFALAICHKAIGKNYVITNCGRQQQFETPTQILERANQPSVLRPVQNLDKDSTIEITAYSDSDWAGALTERKSTTGVVIKLMNSTVCTYARTQQTIAHSSAEAELHAVTSSAAEVLYLRSILLESRLTSGKFHITLHTDSSSGKSLAMRTGPGKRTRHVELRHFWIQELIKAGLLQIKKIAGVDNCADSLTKYVTNDTLEKHLEATGLVTVA